METQFLRTICFHHTVYLATEQKKRHIHTVFDFCTLLIDESSTCLNKKNKINLKKELSLHKNKFSYDRQYSIRKTNEENEQKVKRKKIITLSKKRDLRK